MEITILYVPGIFVEDRKKNGKSFVGIKDTLFLQKRPFLYKKFN